MPEKIRWDAKVEIWVLTDLEADKVAAFELALAELSKVDPTKIQIDEVVIRDGEVVDDNEAYT